MTKDPYVSRRTFIKTAAGLSAAVTLPMIGCSKQRRLTLEFLTIPDPDGWHPSLRLKGDWLILKISDGNLSGYGEASHSKQDDRCREVARQLFDQRIHEFNLTFEGLQELEEELLVTEPDFVTATAWSGINQALYDLLARREQVPVWKLFQSKTELERLPLYTTINRALRNRDHEDYIQLVSEVRDQGFKTFKCAPFEKVTEKVSAVENSREGLATLRILRERFPDLAIRVDFHERFNPDGFFQIVPELEKVNLDWIEEPFEMGDAYLELKKRTSIRLAAGELFWGETRFREFMDHQWVNVIMPDVKHVGGFGPLLKVIEMGKGKIEISPHNPSGPVSTAASVHAAALFPETVQSLEFPFDRPLSRRKYGERIEDGYLYINDQPGWGIEPELS
jgi:galactonate dehydratase